MVVRARISIGLATVVALVALVLPVVTWTVVYPSRLFGSIVRGTEVILTPTSITMGVELLLLLVVLRLRGIHARDLGMSFGCGSSGADVDGSNSDHLTRVRWGRRGSGGRGMGTAPSA